MSFQIVWMGPYILTNIISPVITSIVMLIAGVSITTWRAEKKDWDASSKLALKVNLGWFVVSLITGQIATLLITLLLVPHVEGALPYLIFIIILLISFVINLIIGTLLVSKIYDKEFKESLLFVIVLLSIIYGIGIVLSFAITLSVAIIISIASTPPRIG